MHPDFPLPDLDDPLTRGFWDAAARRQLALTRCEACQVWVWYPTDPSHGCGPGSLTWTAVTGHGTLYSWTVVRRALLPEYAQVVPYTTALIELDEVPGVRLVSLLADADPARLEADMPMEVTFRPLRFRDSGRSVLAPMFVPQGGGTG